MICVAQSVKGKLLLTCLFRVQDLNLPVCYVVTMVLTLSFLGICAPSIFTLIGSVIRRLFLAIKELSILLLQLQDSNPKHAAPETVAFYSAAVAALVVIIVTMSMVTHVALLC
jgi:hypothetical protein